MEGNFTICRTCLKNVSIKKSINMYKQIEFENEKLSIHNMLSILTNVTYENEDNFITADLCQSCVLQICQFYFFRLKCIKSDKTLKYYPELIFLSNYKQDFSDSCDDELLPNIDENVQCEFMSDTCDIEHRDHDYFISDYNNDLEAAEVDKKNPSDKLINESKQNECVSKNDIKNEVNDEINETEFLEAEETYNNIDCGTDWYIYDDNVYNCRYCTRFYTQKFNLHRHIKQQHKTIYEENKQEFEQERMDCAKCKKIFYSGYNSLRRHTSKTHPDYYKEFLRIVKDNSSKILCEVCGKSNKSKKLLEIHMRQHTGERPFMCPTCGKGFVSSSIMRNHLAYHTDEACFTCDICNRAFKRKYNLKTHQNMHSNESKRKHVCHICSRGLNTKQNLHRHIRSHLGEKPYRELEKNRPKRIRRKKPKSNATTSKITMEAIDASVEYILET